jgi:acyl-CoA thioesterase-1
MNWVIYFFGSGTAFFGGVIVLLAGVALASRGRWGRLASAPLALIGLTLIGLSATPLPYWFYAVTGLLSLGWLLTERTKRAAARKSQPWFRAAVVLVWLVGCGMELPFHFIPTVPQGDHPRLTVIGDSVSAGLGDKGFRPWPDRIGEAWGIEVENRSRVGATVGSASRKVAQAPVREGVVLLEIGGNDLLGGTTSDDFERDLQALLQLTTGPGRQVVMFELPLPPFANGFGRVQRRLAEEYGVALVPKWVFLKVLTTDGATSDGIHLTDAGHELMEQSVWQLLRSAYVR